MADTPAKAPQFRWRMLPGWFFTLFGGLQAVVACWLLHAQLLLPTLPNEVPPSAWNMIGSFLMIVAGSIWLYSGLSFLRGRWWPAGIAVVIGYGMGVLAALLAFPEMT